MGVHGAHTLLGVRVASEAQLDVASSIGRRCVPSDTMNWLTMSQGDKLHENQQ